MISAIACEIRDPSGVSQPPLGKHRHAQLELQVGDAGDEVGVARALAVAVDAALHVSRAGLDRGHRVGDRAAGVVVGVDAEAYAGRGDVRDDLGDPVRQHAAVRVTQDDDLGARITRSTYDLEGVVTVGAIAVEEVLEVDEHPLALLAQVGHGVAHHREVLLERRAQRLRDVAIVTLGDQRHDGRTGVAQRLDQRVLRRRDAGAPGGAECRERRVLEVQLLGREREELGVLGVRAGPATLDVADAEVVEVARDVHLVLHGEVEALLLCAVAHRRVVDVEVAHALVSCVHCCVLRSGRHLGRPTTALT